MDKGTLAVAIVQSEVVVIRCKLPVLLVEMIEAHTSSKPRTAILHKLHG